MHCDLSWLLARKITQRIHSSKPASLNRPIARATSYCLLPDTLRLQATKIIYLVFTRVPGKSYCRRLRSLLYLCCLFWALINPLVCWRRKNGEKKHLSSHTKNISQVQLACKEVWAEAITKHGLTSYKSDLFTRELWIGDPQKCCRSLQRGGLGWGVCSHGPCTEEPMVLH